MSALDLNAVVNDFAAAQRAVAVRAVTFKAWRNSSPVEAEWLATAETFDEIAERLTPGAIFKAGELVQNAPVPTRAGYTFDGWYANSADANPNPTKNTAPPKFPAYDITTKPIYLDVILYARWVK